LEIIPAIATDEPEIVAIKKFKPDGKDGEVREWTGVSQSAIREIMVSQSATFLLGQK
jgi:hypothetical protein